MIEVKEVHPSVLDLLRDCRNPSDTSEVVFLWDVQTGQTVGGSELFNSCYLTCRSNRHNNHSATDAESSALHLCGVINLAWNAEFNVVLHARVASAAHDLHDIQLAYIPFKYEEESVEHLNALIAYSRHNEALRIASAVISDAWDYRHSNVRDRNYSPHSLNIWDISASTRSELCPPIDVDIQDYSSMMAAHFASDNTQIITVSPNFLIRQWDLSSYSSIPCPTAPEENADGIVDLSPYQKPGTETYFGVDGQVQIAGRGGFYHCFEKVQSDGWGRIKRPEGDIALFWVPPRFRKDWNDPRLVETIQLGVGPIPGLKINFEMLNKFVGTHWTDIYTGA